MKNKVFAILIAVVLCLAMIIPVSAAGTHIFDPTNVFGEQIKSLEEYAQQIEDSYNYSVIIAVVDSVGQYGTYGYSENLYVSNASMENGIALTYNYGDNMYSFYCSGQAENLFPEDVQANALWGAFAYTETYYEGAYAYLAAVEAILSNAPAVSTTVNTTDTTTQFVSTERTLPLVVDNADVLTDTEEADFTAKLEELGAKYDLEVAILTVNTYEGKDGQAYADDFYDYNGYGYGENDDGLMIVFNTGLEDGTRNITLTTHGTAIDYITDLERDVIFEMMIPSLKNGNYVDAFDCFISEADASIDPSTPIFYIPLSIVIGFALAFLVVKIQASKLKTVRQNVDAADYVGDVMLTGEADLFMYRNVNRVAKKSDSDSSTHTSSSGRTHGGGSRNF